MEAIEYSNQIANYALGHSPVEISRLVDQAMILRPITTRLLKDAGIRPGMRILDIGCGAGDVAMLAADLVGGSGTVLGIDRSEAAIETARARAARIENITFEVGEPEELPDEEHFDMVVGRYVLIFQEDPASLLRVSARLAGPSGIIAFHEIDDADDFAACPAVPSWTRANRWVMSAFRHPFPSFDVPGRWWNAFSGPGSPLQTSFAKSYPEMARDLRSPGGWPAPSGPCCRRSSSTAGQRKKRSMSTTSKRCCARRPSRRTVN
jgi:SAM-dependent methyltransferase